MKLMAILFYFQLVFAESPLDHINPGCPDESICSKETGIKASIWKENLRNYLQNHLSEKELNNILTQKEAFPVNIWADAEAIKSNLNLALWRSPCKQHQDKNNPIDIGEIYLKSIKNIPHIIYSKIIYNNTKEIKAIALPRGDAPIAIFNDHFYYTKDDDGLFYGLLISQNGELKISKTKSIKKYPREVSCPKEMSELFLKEAPSLNFYKGSFCKEIWNNDKNAYETILVGWSCN